MKKALSLILIMVLLLSFSACQSGEDETTNAINVNHPTIKNIVDKTGTDISIVIQDSNLFPSLRKSDINHDRIFVSASNPGFQMCVRTAGRIMSGCLGDCCYGATCFHNADELPTWAISRGYIADINDVLFYL